MLPPPENQDKKIQYISISMTPLWGWGVRVHALLFEKNWVYINICAKYGLDVPQSKWEIPSRVVENERAKIL